MCLLLSHVIFLDHRVLLRSIQLRADTDPAPVNRIHKWQTQKLQMKTFSELAECLALIPPKITLYGRLFKYNYVGCL